mmetsp:Transcript_12592/g.17207  ORF Transcript_12592/g.17207 Transcript_12592/m.17207 type:complete len:148 (+) Transcript_12592:316-759(+)
MFGNLLGTHGGPGDEIGSESELSMGDKVKGFFGAKPPSTRQKLVDELRGALDLQPESSGFMLGLDKYTQQMKINLGFEDAPDPSIMNELDEATSMTYQQRFYAFCISLSLGFACSVLSWLFYFNTNAFAVTNTFGNLLALSRAGIHF